MKSNLLQAAITTATSANDQNIFVFVKTRDGTSTLTVNEVKNFESDMFDNLLECSKPNQEGNFELMLPINTKVWKRAVACMETKKYCPPPHWSADPVLPELLETQLSFFAPRPLTTAITAQEAAKAAAMRRASAIPTGFVLIDAGEFMMGSPTSEAGRKADEAQRLVKLTRPFWLQATPVTQRQWRDLMGNNPSYFHADGPGGELAADRPVETVSWYDAAAYCNALSVRENLPEYYDLSLCVGTPGAGSYRGPVTIRTRQEGIYSYRLPTEAEQQRARRGSDPTTTHRATYAPVGTSLNAITWNGRNSGNRTRPVGLKRPTNEGLHEGLGNVFQWCDGFFAQHLPAPRHDGKVWDPQGADHGGFRAAGGASWLSPVHLTRAAYRHFDRPYARSSALGFRPARFVPTVPEPVNC